MKATEQAGESNTRAYNPLIEKSIGGEPQRNFFTSPVTRSALLKESPKSPWNLVDVQHQTRHTRSCSDPDLTKTSSEGQC
jgi:hypothetical protein